MELQSPSEPDRSSESPAEAWHPSQEIEQPELPPADHGKGAWLALSGCVFAQVPIWGFSLAWGVFQEFLSQTELGEHSGSIAIIGTTSSGILYMLSPITFSILTKYPHLRKPCGWVGATISIAGFLLASFATQMWQLVITLGVLSAVGNGLLFTPTTLYLDEWFIRRKGLSMGTMWAGKSVAGVVLPFVAQTSLSRFGMRNTLRAWAVLTAIITIPLLRFIRPRLPLPATRTPRRLDMSFLRVSTFWILEMSNIIQGLGYFLPSAYLSSFARDIGLSDTYGTLVLALFNGTSIFGGVVMGILCDKFDVTNIILLSSLASAASVLLFWGLCPSHGSGVVLLTLFSVTYGFFAGGFSSTWSGVLNEVKRANPGMETGLVFGLLAGGRGIGNVISGPVSSALMQNQVGDVGGFSTSYGGLILFTGLTAALAGYNGVWKGLSRLLSVF